MNYLSIKLHYEGWGLPRGTGLINPNGYGTLSNQKPKGREILNWRYQESSVLGQLSLGLLMLT